MLPRVLAAALAALVLASCGGGGDDEPEPAAAPAASPGATAGLTDLAGIFPLRAAFNADAGRTRVLLLLAPT